jgi:hypothetical protein
MKVRLGCLFPVLALAGCAGTQRPAPEDVRPNMFLSKLSTVFRTCGTGHVARASLTDYQVTACNLVATYHCPTVSLRDDPVCRLEAVGPAPLAEEDAPPDAPPPTAPPRAPLTPADAAEADRLFEEGRTLDKADRREEACRRFVQSDAIARTFGTAVNLGDCALRAGQFGLAWQLYEDAARAAERDGAADLATFARKRGAAIATRLYTIVVRIPRPRLAGLSLRIGDRDLPPAAAVRVLVDPGDIDVVVSRHGTPVYRRALRGVAGKGVVVEVPAGRLRSVAPASAPPAP